MRAAPSSSRPPSPIRVIANAISIRRAEPDDVDALIALAHGASLEADTHVISGPGELPDHSRVLRQIAASLASDRRLMLVAERDGRLAGRLSLRAERRSRLAHRARFSILVAREHRGTGVGTALIREMLAWVGAHPRLQKVSLNVASHNTRARRLYESFGFAVEGIANRGIHLSDGRFVDDLTMSLWVDKPVLE